jgi:hypothetical protein
MTSFVAVFLAAWAVGYVLGFKVRVVRMALSAG